VKKICFLSVFCALFLISCSPDVRQPAAAIDIEEMRSICNLAVLDCYYHNVAKLNRQEKALLRNTERTIWMDYTAKIKVGIDASLLTIAVDGAAVTITLPAPKALQKPNIIEDSITYFSSEGKDTTKITPEERLEAVGIANANMLSTVRENSSLMLNAENRVKEILKSYVDRIGELSDTAYTITWQRLPDVPAKD